jgi:hypothetical protein
MRPHPDPWRTNLRNALDQPDKAALRDFRVSGATKSIARSLFVQHGTVNGLRSGTFVCAPLE